MTVSAAPRRDPPDPLPLIARELAQAARPCITSSFQADGVVLLHMLLPRRPNIEVLFIDTFHHFDETIAYRDRLASEWRLNLVTVRTEDPRPGLWRTSADECCARHKVDPLFERLAPYDTWFAALRRDQSPTRSRLQEVAPFGLPDGRSIRKVSPLASWTARDVDDYVERHRIPLLPLYREGFTSIGCAPCTQVPTDPSEPRSGRWNGTRLECGIHVEIQRRKA